METRFYMTYARDSPLDIIDYAEKHQVPLMTSAMNRYSTAYGRFMEMDPYKTPRVVDSGGFTAMEQHGDYPWTVKEYHNWLQQNTDKFEWAAVMDLACEELFDDLLTKKERMEKTIENTVEHFSYDRDYELIPVLQGRTVDDWVWSYEQLVKHGVPVENVGLGTVCRVSSSFRLVEIEKKLRERCPKIDKIHGFGVKMTAFSCGVSFESADSYAWSYPANFGRLWGMDKGGRLQQREASHLSTTTRRWACFRNYYDVVSRLHERATAPDEVGITFTYKWGTNW